MQKDTVFWFVVMIYQCVYLCFVFFLTRYSRFETLLSHAYFGNIVILQLTQQQKASTDMIVSEMTY